MALVAFTMAKQRITSHQQPATRPIKHRKSPAIPKLYFCIRIHQAHRHQPPWTLAIGTPKKPNQPWYKPKSSLDNNYIWWPLGKEVALSIFIFSLFGLGAPTKATMIWSPLKVYMKLNWSVQAICGSLRSVQCSLQYAFFKTAPYIYMKRLHFTLCITTLF